MKDITIIVFIIIFWILTATSLTYIYKDPFVTGSADQGDRSIINTSNINLTDTPETATVSTTYSFISMAFRMVTFRLPQHSDIPRGIIIFIEWLNFLLVVMFGLVIYRQIRSGAG